MTLDINKYLVGIVIGLRFAPNFTIRDNFGKLSDMILYRKDSFFNPTMFSILASVVEQTALSNEKTGDTLIINASNVVLTLNIKNTMVTIDEKLEPNIKFEDLPKIYDRFEKDIIFGTIKTFSVNRIQRIGLANRYLFNSKELADSFCNKTIGNTMDGINEISLRFSKKYPTVKALATKEINDYHNVIYNIGKKANKDELYIALDYQEYYSPALETLDDLKYSDFISSAYKYNQETFPKWLSNYD